MNAAPQLRVGSARERLLSVVPSDVVELIEAVVDERVAELTREQEPPWLTLEQAAERLGCSPDAVRMRIKRGRLQARHQGRRVYVSRASVDAL